ncbi:hypothetical protein HDU96_008179 [Phlyctochytrium bullatum]|nr:hypothetical protein HDU96_008179 [Phlyctochytrium bullatum]
MRQSGPNLKFRATRAGVQRLFGQPTLGNGAPPGTGNRCLRAHTGLAAGGVAKDTGQKLKFGPLPAVQVNNAPVPPSPSENPAPGQPTSIVSTIAPQPSPEADPNVMVKPVPQPASPPLDSLKCPDTPSEQHPQSPNPLPDQQPQVPNLPLEQQPQSPNPSAAQQPQGPNPSPDQPFQILQPDAPVPKPLVAPNAPAPAATSVPAPRASDPSQPKTRHVCQRNLLSLPRPWTPTRGSCMSHPALSPELQPRTPRRHRQTGRGGIDVDVYGSGASYIRNGDGGDGERELHGRVKELGYCGHDHERNQYKDRVDGRERECIPVRGPLLFTHPPLHQRQ